MVISQFKPPKNSENLVFFGHIKLVSDVQAWYEMFYVTENGHIMTLEAKNDGSKWFYLPLLGHIKNWVEIVEVQILNKTWFSMQRKV